MALQQWEDLKNAQDLVLKKRLEAEQESVRCRECGSTWFTEREFFQFKADHNVIIGQNVPHRFPGSVGFILLECLHCKNLIEPRVQSSTRDMASGTYDNFLDTIEGKLDTRKKEVKS
jgi:hypothetical protein